jgi:hypothetical protein
VLLDWGIGMFMHVRVSCDVGLAHRQGSVSMPEQACGECISPEPLALEVPLASSLSPLPAAFGGAGCAVRLAGGIRCLSCRAV